MKSEFQKLLASTSLAFFISATPFAPDWSPQDGFHVDAMELAAKGKSGKNDRERPDRDDRNDDRDRDDRDDDRDRDDRDDDRDRDDRDDDRDRNDRDDDRDRDDRDDDRDRDDRDDGRDRDDRDDGRDRDDRDDGRDRDDRDDDRGRPDRDHIDDDRKISGKDKGKDRKRTRRPEIEIDPKRKDLADILSGDVAVIDNLGRVLEIEVKNRRGRQVVIAKPHGGDAKRHPGSIDSIRTVSNDKIRGQHRARAHHQKERLTGRVDYKLKRDSDQDRPEIILDLNDDQVKAIVDGNVVLVDDLNRILEVEVEVEANYRHVTAKPHGSAAKQRPGPIKDVRAFSSKSTSSERRARDDSERRFIKIEKKGQDIIETARSDINYAESDYYQYLSIDDEIKLIEGDWR